MKYRSLLAACVVGAVALTMPHVAPAQVRPSHQDDPDDTPPKNITKLLDARRGLKVDDLDSDMLRNLIKNFNIDPNQIDPETVKDFLDKNPQFKDPKNIERLREMVKQQQKDPVRPDDPKVDWNNLQERLKKIEEFRKNQKVDPMNPIDPMNPMAMPPFQPMPPKQGPPKQPARTQDKQTDELAKWFSRNLKDSPAMRDTIKDLGKLLSKDGKKGPGFLGDLEKEWKAFTGSSRKDDKTGKQLNDFAKDFKLPDLKSGGGGGGGSPPRTGGDNSNSNSSGRTTSFGDSGGSRSFGGFGGGSWTPVVILALLAAGALLFWLLYLRKKPEPEIVEDDANKRWPVDPGAVATREDVVKAFEFLSVSKCGDEAINWHHHQIADQMGVKEPDRREAADRLAGLYEKARYAPANELFTENDIAEARARLILLAGVPTV